MIRLLLPKVLVAVISLLFTYIASDAAYRIYTYAKAMRYAKGSDQYKFLSVPTPLYVFDQGTGYRYKAHSQFRLMQFDGNNNLWQSNVLKVNNMGHISPTDDVIQKPKSEFRIAILGDSFTASITNEIPWPAILEQVLNADSSLKRSLGVSALKVINFAMDGTGIVQFAAIYQSEVQRFDPDLVIVNFITDDIGRKFIWRTTAKIKSSTDGYRVTLTCFSLPATFENSDCTFAHVIVLDSSVVGHKDKLPQIKREIMIENVRRIQWFSPYPELLAKVLSLFDVRITRRIDTQLRPYYESQEEAIRASLDAFRTIVPKHPRVLVLHSPVYEEIVSKKMPSPVLELMARESSLKIVPMLNFLPAKVDDEEIKSWFNYPYDGHFSNSGAEVYAKAVYRSVREYLLPQ